MYSKVHKEILLYEYVIILNFIISKIDENSITKTRVILIKE